MFETEDMLPRAAPKPTSSLGLNEPVVKPIVPEVSILFNQAVATTCTNNPMQQNKPPVQSYASWKKQMLPKVTYPPGAENASAVENAVVKSNLYPMRTVSTVAYTTSSNNGNCVYACINRNETQTQQQRRSLESYAPVYSNAQITAVSASSNPNLVQMQQQQYMRRSLETLPVQRCVPPTAMPQTPIIRPITATEVLTICAGTQTDSIGLSTQCNTDVANKQDFQHLLGILQEMRLEQQRLTEICVLLMEQQQRLQPTMTENKGAVLKNASTQCDEAVKATCQQREAVLIKDYHTAEHYEVQQPPPNDYRQKCLPNIQQQQTHQNNQNFQSPRVRPAAHSTGYRLNSPQQNQNQPQHNVMSKPATEQSMVMNELALKYLPNDKLNEMLQEMRLLPAQQKVINEVDYAAAATATPLRNIENIDKEPNDISNASYKYLKKYRLLPEEQQHQQQQQKQQFQREQSPLAGHPRPMQEHLLDLDAIRRQPKFL